jgi:NitT/TauT family transport system ATP-binding protein
MQGGAVSFGVLEHVRKVFPVEALGRGAREPLVAIDDASMRFEEGELVSLLGPSGCGKTTLLRIIAGLIPKTAGSVKVRGEEVTEPHPDFGFVFQQPNLMPWRSVLDNVLFPMEILGRRDAAARARALELIGMVGLHGFYHMRPHQLSGGMQQRVALCRALVHQPKLLLMDEPFGALDELTRMEMNDLLLDIRARTKATVVFVTHSIAEAVYLSDQVLVFSKRPARIAERVAVEIPYPRSAETRYTPRFTELERQAGRALGIFHEAHASAAGPSQGARPERDLGARVSH